MSSLVAQSGISKMPSNPKKRDCLGRGGWITLAARSAQGGYGMTIILRIFFAGFVLVGPPAHAAPDKTILALETLAQSGSTRAQFELGRRYETGIGTTSNSTRAFNLYCKAASKGHPMASYRLGTLYLAGKGVKRDEAMAVAWLGRSIELGHPAARDMMPRFASIAKVPTPGCYGGKSPKKAASLPCDAARLGLSCICSRNRPAFSSIRPPALQP